MSDEPPPPYDLSGVVFPCTRPLKRLRLRLMRSFPDDVAKTDKRFGETMGGPVCGYWLTVFAEATARAMHRRDATKVDGHLATILSSYTRGGHYLRGLIDVNYMEDLFYKVKNADAQWGWQRVPEPLRRLYKNFWGDTPRFLARLRPGTITE
jgi:hypothetical protein